MFKKVKKKWFKKFYEEKLDKWFLKKKKTKIIENTCIKILQTKALLNESLKYVLHYF